MALRIFNTLNKKKEIFEPFNPPKVSIYVCGPTVYDFVHIGNFRVAVFFNLVRNWLEYLKYDVVYISNFTDIDDKIINKANKENTSIEHITKKYISEYISDFSSLKLKEPDFRPKATEYINEIINMIKNLIQKNIAYQSERGEVFFSIRSFKEYGKLSGRNLDQLKSGVRVEIDRTKKDPLDFTLWKPAKEGEPSWDSPWGKGRPGWHIECSVMALKYAGETLDIHGGGCDLIFPHHENEIAQSEANNSCTFVRYWMHNNLITFESQKMSKSLGNIMLARNFIAEYGGETLKFLLLQVHYRSVCDFSEEQIDNAISGLARIYSAMKLAFSYLQSSSKKSGEIKELNLDKKYLNYLQENEEKIYDFLNDDFNTPKLFAQLFEVVRNFNSMVKVGMKEKDILLYRSYYFLQFIKKIGSYMELFQENPVEFLYSLDNLLIKRKNLSRSEIEKLIVLRNTARQNKDYQKSDEIRDKLLKMGICINDTAKGTCWEVMK